MNKDATNYLLVDIGESGIMYMGVTGYPATGIQYLTRGVKLGSALQINNAKANYVFHLKEIRDSILEKCMSFETEVVTINLPST